MFLLRFGSVPRGPPGAALLGTWCGCCGTVFLLLWMMKAWWEGLFFLLHPVQCLLHREPVKNNAKCVVPSKTQPPLYRPLHSLFSTDLMHRSHYPGPCSCWSDLCCTRYFSFRYSFIKHEVRPLLTFRDEQSLVFVL